MARYVILSDAREDLEQIDEYTMQNWGIEQADAYLEALTTIFELLAVRPSIGRDRSEDIGPGYMSFGHKSHVIYYKRMTGGVAIAAVFHHSVVPQKHLMQRMGDDE